jgi:hypothetical protein
MFPIPFRYPPWPSANHLPAFAAPGSGWFRVPRFGYPALAFDTCPLTIEIDPEDLGPPKPLLDNVDVVDEAPIVGVENRCVNDDRVR